MGDEDPLLAFSKGDVRRARHLRYCLTVIRDRAPDPAARGLAEQVLDGRSELRAALREPALTELVVPRLRHGLRELPLDDEDELRELAAEGRRRYLGRTNDAAD